jgi:2-iminobutanoate/2-iminopropanoate deaminase
VIKTPNAPAAIGPYSQALLAKNTLYVSGQLPLDPKTGALISGDIAAQTKQVLANLAAILAAAGFKMDDAVQTQVYLTNMNDFAAMNEVYATAFKVFPARATVQVNRLAKDAQVEISMIAVKDD